MQMILQFLSRTRSLSALHARAMFFHLFASDLSQGYWIKLDSFFDRDKIGSVPLFMNFTFSFMQGTQTKS